MNARILVVDDEADSRLLLRMMLVHAGYDVTLAAGGEEALESLAETPPDLLLSDVMMAGLDGLALLRRVRTDPKTSALPVILLTAKSATDEVAEGLRLGADDYLTKPFRIEELLVRVRAKITHPPVPGV
jgi:DNA-binding response OmpR family regulator